MTTDGAGCVVVTWRDLLLQRHSWNGSWQRPRAKGSGAIVCDDAVDSKCSLVVRTCTSRFHREDLQSSSGIRRMLVNCAAHYAVVGDQANAECAAAKNVKRH